MPEDYAAQTPEDNAVEIQTHPIKYLYYTHVFVVYTLGTKTPEDNAVYICVWKKRERECVLCTHRAQRHLRTMP
jgi:hypothetical protein